MNIYFKLCILLDKNSRFKDIGIKTLDFVVSDSSNCCNVLEAILFFTHSKYVFVSHLTKLGTYAFLFRS